MKNKKVDILQKLYDEEINFYISCFWDAGFYWGLGHEGGEAEGHADNYEGAVENLMKATIETYPSLADVIKLDEVEHCEWYEDKNSVWWPRKCFDKPVGYVCAIEDTPEAEGFMMCPYCGKEIKEIKA